MSFFLAGRPHVRLKMISEINWVVMPDGEYDPGVFVPPSRYYVNDKQIPREVWQSILRRLLDGEKHTIAWSLV